VRRKVRLVAKGYSEHKCLTILKLYAFVAWLKAIRILLLFVAYSNIKLYQMDVKSAFLNGFIQEEVYIEQPSNFEDLKHPNHVYKLNKDYIV